LAGGGFSLFAGRCRKRREAQLNKRPMNKRVLLLSAASAALLSGPVLLPAHADNLDITSATKEAVKPSAAANSSAGDITIETTGSITVKAASPAVTLDSNNKVSNLGTISNQDTANAVGIGIDTGTALTRTGTLSNTGTIDLSGTGTGKTGIQLGGTGNFVGNITLATPSSISVTGDSSYGVSLVSGTTLTGNLNVGGAISMTPTTVNETPSSGTGLVGVFIGGHVTGNVAFDSSTAIGIYGHGSRGVLQTGAVDGSFVNSGSISTIGFQSTTNRSTGLISTPANSNNNPEAGTALGIGGSILGGFLNNGPVNSSDSTALAAITMSGGSSGLVPALRISPTLASSAPTAPLTIGVYAPDTADPGFSFYNRGSIAATSVDPDLNVNAVEIDGYSPTIYTRLDGLGLFNAGNITAAATTTDKGGSTATTATAMAIGTSASAADTFIGNGSAGSGIVNSKESGRGQISATLSGTRGGSAYGIAIGTSGSVNSIINSGIISASAATTNPSEVTALNAIAIQDLSGTLSNITNTGSILATATTLGNGAQRTVAANLSANTSGVTFINGTATTAGTVAGDILFGDGSDTLTVTGVSPSQISTITGNINFGDTLSGSGDLLHVASFGTVSGSIVEDPSGILDVRVDNRGVLNTRNATTTLSARNFDVAAGGALNVTVASTLPNNTAIHASGEATLDATNFGVSYGSYIPEAGRFVLVEAPTGNLNISSLSQIQTNVGGTVPFLLTGDVELLANQSGFDQLVLNLAPKSADVLGLTGYAASTFPYVNMALQTDPALGSAILNNVTSNEAAQAAYSAFAPDASGGARAVAISLTDQATGPVGARQRVLRLYSKQPGETTLWGQEFAQYINDKGNNGLPGFKDQGFGFVLGADGGDPFDGWYGGAFTFFTGNINAREPASSRADAQWYMLTGYTDWRGKGLFLDTQASIGYGDISGHRFLTLGNVTRQADAKRSGLLGAIGATTGAMFVYGATTITPQVSVDGLLLREEGYTETGGGTGFDLAVNPHLSSSLRGYFGTSIRQDINLGSFYLQPEARVGYRYDFVANAMKLTASFPGVTGTGAGTGDFTIVGPDPARGNLVAGASLAATTGTWSLGINYDLVSGSHGAMTQVGTVTLVGRI